MSSENSSEWFDQCIEYTEGENDSEKENVPIKMKQPKTTKEQFVKMTAFANENDEELMDKDTYKLLWDNLAAKLNDIGPPDHTVAEWRRIWSVHKHNAKHKRLVTESDPDKARKIIRLDEASTSLPLPIPNDGRLSEISEQLRCIIENQGETLVNQSRIIDELKSSNKLLQELVRKSQS